MSEIVLQLPGSIWKITPCFQGTFRLLYRLTVVEEAQYVLHKITLQGRIHEYVVPRGALHVKVQFLVLPPHLVVEEVDLFVQVFGPLTRLEGQAVTYGMMTVLGGVSSSEGEDIEDLGCASIAVMVLNLVEDILIPLPPLAPSAELDIVDKLAWSCSSLVLGAKKARVASNPMLKTGVAVASPAEDSLCKSQELAAVRVTW